MSSNISRRRFIHVLGFGAASGVALAACGGGAPASAPADASASAPSASGGAAPAGSGGDVTLEIASAGDDSKFDKEALEAKAGSKITVKFTNNAKPETNKQFNWVLVKKGMQLKVVNDGLTEGEASGYVKPGDPNVIIATKLLKPGESETVTFDAPEPGQYPYVCTFPGFYTRMRGVLTITS